MIDYTLNESNILTSGYSPKGTQKKYYEDGYFYKVNRVGNEGLVEWLVSEVLSCAVGEFVDFVKYEYCFINGKKGCRSKDFLRECEFVSAESLYRYITGYQGLSEYLMSGIPEVKDRIRYLIDLFKEAGLIEAEGYLKTLAYLDMLILNEDRHSDNYGIIIEKKTGRLKPCPIFDNGYSLKIRLSPEENAIACMVSGSFESAVEGFGYPLESPFRLDYKGLYKRIKVVEKEVGSCKEIRVLKNQLEKYKSIFNYRG